MEGLLIIILLYMCVFFCPFCFASPAGGLVMVLVVLVMVVVLITGYAFSAGDLVC